MGDQIYILFKTECALRIKEQLERASREVKNEKYGQEQGCPIWPPIGPDLHQIETFSDR